MEPLFPEFDFTKLLAWVDDAKLKLRLLDLAAGNKPKSSEAQEVMQLLIQSGNKRIRKLVGDSFYNKNFPTNRHGGPWAKGNPIGWVDHYTAATSASGTLAWFSSQARKPGSGNSSSHFVVDRDGAVMTLVNPFTTIAWHATWANPTHIGMEHVCTGKLGKSADGKFTYMGNISYPLDRVKDVEEVDGTFWEPFTSAQILSNILVKRLMIAAIPTLKKDNFVDHQAIDPKNKIDCGPLWPLEFINETAFNFTMLHNRS